MMKKNLKPYIVEWDDPATVGRWRDIAQAREETASRCVSVGFLVEKTKKKIVLSLSYDEECRHVSDTIVIPRGVVRSCRRLHTK